MARAIWKGVIRFGAIAVPVKLYSAVEDRRLHFRLLHRKDHQPVQQAMVNPETEAVVPPAQIRRAWISPEGEEILLSQDELAAMGPAPSRDIRVLRFLPPAVIDHRWYDRPYYLGPDGEEEDYAALAAALEAETREGLVQWVMRNKEYFGALRLYRGYPLLISLRHAEQVVSTDALKPPPGKPLDSRELKMARQLIGMLGADFEPRAYHDEYRERVQELIEKKQRGGRIECPAASPKRVPEDLTRALEASLQGLGHG